MTRKQNNGSEKQKQKQKQKPHNNDNDTTTADRCDDDRPLVSDLLEEHAASIHDVRQAILSDETIGKRLWNHNNNNENNNNENNNSEQQQQQQQQRYYDDIWILRYVLSHKGNIQHATKAALRTMEMRETKKMNDEFSDIRHRLKNYGNCCRVVVVSSETKKDNNNNDDNNNDAVVGEVKVQVEVEVESLPNHDLYDSFLGKNSYFALTQPDPDRGVLVYGDMGDIDTAGMMAGMTQEQAIEHLLFQNEAVYQILDEVTRRTGRLTQLTRSIDLGNVSFLQMNCLYRHSKRDARVLNEIEAYHPQLLAGIHIFNTPGWMRGIWTVLKPLFPKRSVEKIHFLSANASRKPYEPLLRQVSIEHLPERFGGKLKEWPPPSIVHRTSPKRN